MAFYPACICGEFTSGAVCAACDQDIHVVGTCFRCGTRDAPLSYLVMAGSFDERMERFVVNYCADCPPCPAPRLREYALYEARLEMTRAEACLGTINHRELDYWTDAFDRQWSLQNIFAYEAPSAIQSANQQVIDYLETRMEEAHRIYEHDMAELDVRQSAYEGATQRYLDLRAQWASDPHDL